MAQITVLGVVKRDIDLLVVEEFAASSDFLQWILQRIGIVEQGEIVAVSLSPRP